jgi:hypothetical protein
MRAAVIRQAFGIHQRFHPQMHRLQVQAAACKKIFQQKPFGGRIGMQREKYPLYLDIAVLLQPFNTPRTEIAPGSNKIGEDF